MAKWIKYVNGVINLDRVTKAVAQSNGDVYLYQGPTNYVALPLGTDFASAVDAVQELTQAFDPADPS